MGVCVCVHVRAQVCVRRRCETHQVTRCLGVRRAHTHTHAEKELVLRQGKQEQAVRSHQPHHTLYYADLGVYCKLIRNPGVTAGLKG